MRVSQIVKKRIFIDPNVKVRNRLKYYFIYGFIYSFKYGFGGLQ